jgi:hypothetical protein
MHDPMKIKTFTAEGAITAKRIVKVGASDGGALQAAGSTIPFLGVSDSIGAASGKSCDVITHGFADVEYGGVVAYGDPLTSDSVGRAVKAEFAAGQIVHIIGFAMQAGVLGDWGSMKINHCAYANESNMIVADVTIAAADVKTLNATPKEVIAAPGATKAIVPVLVVAYKAAGTAYDGIAGGEDLALKYTDANGTQLVGVETTGFMDQATAQTRVAVVSTPVSGTNLTPTANAAIVAHMLTGEIATGTSDLKLRIWYRIVDVSW